MGGLKGKLLIFARKKTLDKSKSKVPTNAVIFKHYQWIIALLWITQNSIWLTCRSLHKLATEDKNQCVWQTNFIGLRWILDSMKLTGLKKLFLQHKITGRTCSERGGQTILIARQDLLLLLTPHAFKFNSRTNNATHSLGTDWMSNGNQK